MKKAIALGGLILSLFVACQKNERKEENRNDEKSLVEEIHFFTSDSIKIYGDLYEVDKNGTTILLFHQGGSNARGEYRSIIPKLIENKYNVFAIDQRLGGQMFGDYNRTVSNIAYKDFSYNGYSYCDAYSDLEHALNYLLKSGFRGKKVLWGSSYSASLAIKLSNDRSNDVSGILAFSPASGDPMKECLPNQYFETLKVPLILFRPQKEADIESVKDQLNLADELGHKTYVAKNGTHGSSMLVFDRVGTDVTENWKAVFDFLSQL